MQTSSSSQENSLKNLIFLICYSCELPTRIMFLKECVPTYCTAAVCCLEIRKRWCGKTAVLLLCWSTSCTWAFFVFYSGITCAIYTDPICVLFLFLMFLKMTWYSRQMWNKFTLVPYFILQVMDCAMPLIGEHQIEDRQHITELVVSKMNQMLSKTPIPSPQRPTATQQPQVGNLCL